MSAEEPDPRLVALGLVPPPAPAPVAAPPAAPPDTPRSVAPADAPAPPSPPAPPPARVDAAPRVEEPARVIEVAPRPAARLRPAEAPEYRIHIGRRRAVLWMDADGLVFVDGGRREIAWSDVRAVEARRGHVRIEVGQEKLLVGLDLDGVEEPSLAAPLADIIGETSTGGGVRPTTLRRLSDTTVDLRDRFRQSDDPMLPLFIAIPAVATALVLAIVLPVLASLPFRAGPAAPLGTFVIYPRISPLDPRVVLAGVLAGVALGALAIRLALRDGALTWARGVARGWPGDVRLLGPLRWLSGAATRHARWLAIAAVVVAATIVPSGRERTFVTERGIDVRAALPFFDRHYDWASVDSVVSPLEPTRPGPRATIITLRDGKIISTADADFVGLSDYALYQFVDQHLTKR